MPAFVVNHQKNSVHLCNKLGTETNSSTLFIYILYTYVCILITEHETKEQSKA